MAEPHPCLPISLLLQSSFLVNLGFYLQSANSDVREIQQYIANHMEFSLGRTRYNLDCFAIYQATAMR